MITDARGSMTEIADLIEDVNSVEMDPKTAIRIRSILKVLLAQDKRIGGLEMRIADLEKKVDQHTAALRRIEGVRL